MKISKKMAKRVAGVTASTCAVVAACPALAFAAEGEGGGISAILPQMDEFIPMLIAFLILWAILAKFGWPLFEGILTKRETAIRESLEKAEEARIESERVLNEYRKQLADARQESATIVAEAKQAGESLRKELAQKAQAEADVIVEKARTQIEAEKKAAVADLQGSVADLTVAVTARIIGQDFSDADHRQLIERSIEEVGNLNA